MHNKQKRKWENEWKQKRCLPFLLDFFPYFLLSFDFFFVSAFDDSFWRFWQYFSFYMLLVYTLTIHICIHSSAPNFFSVFWLSFMYIFFSKPMCFMAKFCFCRFIYIFFSSRFFFCVVAIRLCCWWYCWHSTVLVSYFFISSKVQYTIICCMRIQAISTCFQRSYCGKNSIQRFPFFSFFSCFSLCVVSHFQFHVFLFLSYFFHLLVFECECLFLLSFSCFYLPFIRLFFSVCACAVFICVSLLPFLCSIYFSPFFFLGSFHKLFLVVFFAFFMLSVFGSPFFCVLLFNFFLILFIWCVHRIGFSSTSFFFLFCRSCLWKFRSYTAKIKAQKRKKRSQTKKRKKREWKLKIHSKIKYDEKTTEWKSCIAAAVRKIL